MKSKDAAAVCTNFRSWFIRFGVPEEIGTDGGPPFDSHMYLSFLKTWGVKRRLSSAYYPQGNGRAELAVKAVKRILTDNITASGSLDNDKAVRALLLYRNTPVQGTGYRQQPYCTDISSEIIYPHLQSNSVQNGQILRMLERQVCLAGSSETRPGIMNTVRS